MEHNKETSVDYRQHISAIPKETDLIAEVGRPIRLGDINIDFANICQRCGKPLLLDLDSKAQEFCEHCTHEPTDTAFPFSPDFEKDTDTSSKRDSGFHTLRRGEDHMAADGQAESALSSASSSDSAVLIECNGNGLPDSQAVRKLSLPSIVIDGDGSELQNGLEMSFSPNETVFHDEDKLVPNGTASAESPAVLADKLFHFKGYKRTEIANKLGANTEFSHHVGVEYLKLFDFTKSSLVEAYRDFLSRFALLGETQERERILSHFSKRYIECNPDFLDGQPDSVHTLVCALTLLNTDLHGNVGLSSGRKKMTYKQFVSNLSGLMWDKSDFPKDVLSALYSSIKKTPLPWGGKEPRKLPRSSSMRQNTDATLRPTPTKIVSRSLSTRSPVKINKNISNSSSSSGLGRSAKGKSMSHNQGLLWRKALIDSEGKKVSLGKRGWKVYTVALQNLELHVAKRGSTEVKTISLHHSLAEESAKDSKRQHVFRLTLADTSVTLYQASSDKETGKWIREINKAAALLSAAPLCSPIGSQLVFRRPLLPSAPSTLPLINQFEKVQELLKDHEEDLENTTAAFETEKSKPEECQYYSDKIAYLEFEIKKYQRYVKDLQILMRASSVVSDTESNLGSTDNGSLVSVTPSEPPLASPMPEGSFAFPDSEEANNLPLSAESASFFSSPAHAHLVSPQHKNLTLSPTSSLPNLSPIMETPTKGPLSQTGSARRRQRAEKCLYESSLNDGAEDSPDGAASILSPGQENTNNSNHHAICKPELSGNSLQRVRRMADSSLSGSSTTDGLKMHGRQKHAFAVNRYEMRVAKMEVESIRLEEDSVHGLAVTRSTDRHPSPPHPTEVLPPTVHGISEDTVPHMLGITPTLTRVKGRKERKGIDRYSYMLAVGENDH